MKSFKLISKLIRKKKINLPLEVVQEVIQRNALHPWFIYVFEKRSERWEIWESSFWLALQLDQNARILETGCGCALNLIWFAQNGFHSLYGFDINPNAINAGKELCASFRIPIELWVDNGIKPSFISKEQYDAIIALNWTYYNDAFDLKEFFFTYSKALSPNGFIIFDIINSSYNEIPNNQFLTSDWNKPENSRQPSEYRKRYSKNEVFEAVSAAGLSIVKKITHKQVIPKDVFIIRKDH